MPPKKEEKSPPVLMGRVGTNLKCGILGLPNVGKSTFFNILTKSSAPAENFPFCTIDPNEARCPVLDPRFDFLCEHYQPASRVPAYLNVVDIAGLVRGANEGKGLGNAFLSHVRAVDAMFEMVRIFESEEVTHVDGEVDAVRDLETIADELRLKDLEYVRKEHEHTEKLALRAGDKQKKFEAEVLQRVLHMLEEEKKPIRLATWNEREVDYLNEHLLLTSKPIVYLLNMSEDDYIRKKNKWLGKVKAWVDANDPHATIIPLSCELELRLSDMQSDDERKKYLEEKGAHSAMEKIVTTGYRALQLQYFFTSGKDEVRAWTISMGTKAPQAAGHVHTDMEKGFIIAEVMAFEDFKTEGNEGACRAAGKYKQKGRDYIVEDGDIIFFKFNPPQQSSKKK